MKTQFCIMSTPWNRPSAARYLGQRRIQQRLSFLFIPLSKKKEKKEDRLQNSKKKPAQTKCDSFKEGPQVTFLVSYRTTTA